MSIYNCEECKFITENKRDYQRHIKTKKHQKNVGEIENSKYTINIPQIYHKYTTDIPQDDNIIYECDYCDAGFKHKSGKYRHQKNYCKSKKTSDENIILTQKVEYLEKEKTHLHIMTLTPLIVLEKEMQRMPLGISKVKKR